MSFAAVIGLIVAFRFAEAPVPSTQAARATPGRRTTFLGLADQQPGRDRRNQRIYALYHFQQLVAVWGSLANMIAVPLTALWIMPLPHARRRCSPLWAAEGPALWLAQFGLDGLLCAVAALCCAVRLWPADHPRLARRCPCFSPGFGQSGPGRFAGSALDAARRPARCRCSVSAWAMAEPLCRRSLLIGARGLLALMVRDAPFLSGPGRSVRCACDVRQMAAASPTDQLARFSSTPSRKHARTMDTCVINIPANGLALWLTTNASDRGPSCAGLPCPRQLWRHQLSCCTHAPRAPSEHSAVDLRRHCPCPWPARLSRSTALGRAQGFFKQK